MDLQLTRDERGEKCLTCFLFPQQGPEPPYSEGKEQTSLRFGGLSSGLGSRGSGLGLRINQLGSRDSGLESRVVNQLGG